MKFGIMQGLLAEPLETMFATAAQLGLSGVQLNWPGDKGAPIPDGCIAMIRDRASAAGVEVPSLIAHPASNGVIDPSGDVQSKARDGLRESMSVARQLGATVILVPFFGGSEIATPEQEARLIENLRAVAKEAEAASVILAIECTLAGDATVWVLDAIGSKAVASYWDMGNAMWYGCDPVREVEQLRGYIAEVHAKEYFGEPVLSRPRKAGGLNGRPFGQGQVPVRKVLAGLRKGGYDGYVVLETGVFGDRRESIRAALEVLKVAAGV